MASRTLMAAAAGVGGWNIEAAAGGISIHHSYVYSSAYFPNPSNSNSNKTHVLVVAAAATGGGHEAAKKKSDEKWVAKGVITESLPNAMFWVRLENGGDVVLGYVSGKIRRNSIRMLPGDYVNIELTRYDSTRGRIVYRLQPNNAKH